AQLAGELPALRLEIVGDGPLREGLEALAAELEIEDRVLFHGALPSGAVGEVLDRAGLFALPARTAEDGDMDGLPVAILEALAHGVPVVATPVAGIPEAVMERQTGLIVAPSDVNATASAIRTLATDDALRTQLGQAGRALVAERYDAATSAAALRRLFAEY
ncbi:MAG: glycosyltransferase, partial [Solirubrobacteraceae bacterium]|nr:glycosyltransferase [Solirubrobacteraceae bacterium]